MAIHVQHDVTIGRPVHEVSDFLADLENEVRYGASVKSMKLVSGTPGRPGATYERVFETTGAEERAIVTLKEVEPARKIVVQTGPDEVRARSTLLLAPIGVGSTRVDMHMEVLPHGFARLFRYKFRKKLKQDVQASLQRLKDYMESEPYRTKATIMALRKPSMPPSRRTAGA